MNAMLGIERRIGNKVHFRGRKVVDLKERESNKEIEYGSRGPGMRTMKDIEAS